MRPRGVFAGLLLALTWAASAAGAEPLHDRPHCQHGLFCIAAERQGEQITLWLETETTRPLTLVVQPLAEGLEGPSAPLRLHTDRPARQLLARFRIARPGDWRLDWSYSFHPGHVRADHAPEAPYRLPYPPGRAYRVLQGAEGEFSHRGPLGHAIDWAMPLGAEIRAARGGQVIGLRDDAGDGGRDPALRGQENYLWIRHPDGTVGHYLHLLQDSLLVALDERVVAGQPIARAGNSGFSTEPHLHFHVATPTPDGPEAFQTFPLQFDLGDGPARPLEAGRSYRAPGNVRASQD